MTLFRAVLLITALASTTAVTLFFTVAPGWIDATSNTLTGEFGEAPDADSLSLHDSLIIGDLHSDTALWSRPLTQRASRGHMDIPRLIEGNVALQMFTTVTKAPQGQNYRSNSAEAPDTVTWLGLAQRWPGETRTSLTARALHQADRIQRAAEQDPRLLLVTTTDELDALLARRTGGDRVIGALLGVEGAHALDGELANIDTLFDAGIRMVGLQHFFDNRLGGSLHGQSKGGLSPFGEAAVDHMLARGMLIDVAHSSEAVVRDVLGRSDRPLIVSHTGFRGHCDSDRNISDATMAMITEQGGLVGVGFWGGAVCGSSIDAIVGALRYGIDTFGLEHIALGSDWDGTTATPIDAAGIAHLTHALRQNAFSDEEIRAVMGGNMVRFLRDNLPRG